MLSSANEPPPNERLNTRHSLQQGPFPTRGRGRVSPYEAQSAQQTVETTIKGCLNARSPNAHDANAHDAPTPTRRLFPANYNTVRAHVLCLAHATLHSAPNRASTVSVPAQKATESCAPARDIYRHCDSPRTRRMRKRNHARRMPRMRTDTTRTRTCTTQRHHATPSTAHNALPCTFSVISGYALSHSMQYYTSVVTETRRRSLTVNIKYLITLIY